MGLKHLLAASAAILIGAAAMTVSTSAQDKPTIDAAQKEEIRKVIKEYLLEQPEVLQEAIEILNQRMTEKTEKEQKVARAQHLAPLYKEKTPFSIGDGKVTVVEFFDYNCPYCSKAFDEIGELAKEDKDVRVVFVEFPILSKESLIASQAAIAASKQNKYWEYHQALMKHRGRKTEEIIFQTARDVGLDIDKLKADMKAPEVEEIIRKNRALADAMGVEATPYIFIGDEVIPGAPEDFKSQLQAAVANVRSKGCSIC
jgi:protein-disulfide isomerase